VCHGSCSPSGETSLRLGASCRQLRIGGTDGGGIACSPGEFEGSRYARPPRLRPADHSMYKDPVCAAALGLVPGLGYVYAGIPLPGSSLPRLLGASAPSPLAPSSPTINRLLFSSGSAPHLSTAEARSAAAGGAAVQRGVLAGAAGAPFEGAGLRRRPADDTQRVWHWR
jgi:hypothetical protein